MSHNLVKNTEEFKCSWKSALKKHFGLYIIPEPQEEMQQGYCDRCLPQTISRKCTQIKGKNEKILLVAFDAQD